jgi:hypothetical protein
MFCLLLVQNKRHLKTKNRKGNLKVLSSPVRWIRPKLGLFDMSSLKSEARREPFKVTAPSRTAVGYLETNSKCGNENLIYRCQFRGAFIAPLPTDKNNILGLKCSLRHWKQIANLFERRCQQLYVVIKGRRQNCVLPWQFVSK